MKKTIYGVIGLLIIVSIIAKIGGAIGQTFKSESPEELAVWVKQSISEEILKDPDYNGISISEVVLIKESSKKFTGFAKFTAGSQSEKAHVSVTTDANQKLYECAPPRSLFFSRKNGNTEAENKYEL